MGLDQLCGSLDQLVALPGGSARVAQVLGAYAASAEDWRRFALFDPSTYARNLVRETVLYELLVLCWGAGQVSPVHNHQGQRCWMAVLEGAVEERLYQPPAGAGPRPLLTLRNQRYGTGSVAFIQDELGLHDIRPIDSRPAVTLHLYSLPIKICQIYDPASGSVQRRTLSYHSRGGVMYVPEVADPIDAERRR
jgi:cysteine dioxygenase